MSSFVEALLKIVESCWEYFEKSGIFLEGDVALEGVGSLKGGFFFFF